MPPTSVTRLALDKVISWEPSKSPSNHLFPYIDISSVNRDTKRIEGATQHWTHDAPSRARQIVKAGDILVSTVRPNLNAVAQVPPALDNATASTGFCVLHPDQKKLDGGYLYYWVRNPLFVSAMVKKATGASYPAISDTIVKESCLPLPPLPDQRRIAAILHMADAIRRKQQRVMERMEDFLRSVFLDMFGDPATNPKGWRVAELGTVAMRFSDGPFGSNLKTSHYVDAGVRVVRLQNIGVGKFLDEDKAFVSEQHFSSLKKHECIPGDVLIGTLGDPNLRACILPQHIYVALNKADCIQLRPNLDIATPEYICSFLNTPAALSLASGFIHGQT
jgi:type I restriction enzyme S subunit